jgi:exopolysaccharide biosynthesis protein
METEQKSASKRKDRRKKTRKYVLTKLAKKIILTTFIIISIPLIICVSTILVLRAGVFPSIQEYLVTSSITTLNHKYIANIVASPNQIKTIMNSNRVDENYDKENTSLIVKSTKSADENPAELTDISQDGYKGYLLKIADPKKVFIGTTSQLGTHGTKISELIKQYDAFAGINASGFTDIAGHGNGGSATGILIANGEIKYKDDTLTKYNIIGFNRNDVLVLGKYTLDEVKNLNLRDAVDFHPFLIVNGVPTKIYGNGGWGSGPRTAIGQKADGTILMVVVDGRQITSLGASMKQMQDIMLKNGAINAANLDGGSSTVMYYKDKIVNSPCSPYGDRFLPSAFLVSK